MLLCLDILDPEASYGQIPVCQAYQASKAETSEKTHDVPSQGRFGDREALEKLEQEIFTLKWQSKENLLSQTNKLGRQTKEQLEIEIQDIKKALRDSEQKLSLEQELRERETREKLRVQDELESLKKIQNGAQKSSPELEQSSTDQYTKPQASQPAGGVAVHALSRDEPLVLEEMIKSCFSNPRRQTVSDFALSMSWQKIIRTTRTRPRRS